MLWIFTASSLAATRYRKTYGLCRNIPVLLYHHLQPLQEAINNGQKNLSVDVKIFEKQMEYLSKHGYSSLTPEQFLSTSADLPAKPVLLTFDDGYSDFYTYAYPILMKYGMRATVFVITGLIDNPGYLSWSNISKMKESGLISFANHTWSHKNLALAKESIIRYEILTAKEQLEEHGITSRIFAYPYGGRSKTVEKVLKELGFEAAFTTVAGWSQCLNFPYEFRRNRIGNASMAAYGL
jgi:peptidoglycan/xylan/chitin deacetylase (PgdA/CDA1 family)